MTATEANSHTTQSHGLRGQATAWRNEHGRMLRALRSEVGVHADLEAVLSASGGDVIAAAAPWRGRAATIGLLQEKLRAAQATAGQVCQFAIAMMSAHAFAATVLSP